MTISSSEPATMLYAQDLPAHALTVEGGASHPPFQLHVPDSSMNIVTATITAAASMFAPEQRQFVIIDTSGRDAFAYLSWLPHVAAIHTVRDANSAAEARDSVAGLLDSREDYAPAESKVYVVVNGFDDPRSRPELREAMDALESRGGKLGVWGVRSNVQ